MGVQMWLVNCKKIFSNEQKISCNNYFWAAVELLLQRKFFIYFFQKQIVKYIKSTLEEIK